MSDRQLSVFLCHSSLDKPVVRDLYQQLDAEGWIDPWLDEEKLLPGQDWDLEIEKAVEAADVVVVCLSNNSITKEGYVQRELKFVLDIALEKPEGTIFVIPLRLEDCIVPRRLRPWHYVDYFPMEARAHGYQRLLQSLRFRLNQLLLRENEIEETRPFAATPVIENVQTAPVVKIETAPQKKTPPEPIPVTPAPPQVEVERVEGIEIAGSLLLSAYFVLAGLYVLGFSSQVVQVLLAIFALLAGSFLLYLRKVPTNIVFRISITLFLLIHAVVISVEGLDLDVPLAASILEGLVALTVGGSLAATIRSRGKPAFFSSLYLTLFLFLFAGVLIMNQFGYTPPGFHIPIIMTSIVTPILLWVDM